MLEILGQASDSHTIQNHLMSIFDNTRAVKFHDIDYNKITAIMSSEGEIIQVTNNFSNSLALYSVLETRDTLSRWFYM